MFYYFGGKKRLAPYYPAPKHDTIIEPFAGAAAYSCLYWDRSVVLIEKDERIYNIWKWMQQATSQDILDLPMVEKGQRVTELGLPQPAADLISFHFARGTSRPQRVPGNYNSWNEKKRKELADWVFSTRHWTIIHGDYTDAPDIEATWFIDPPYQVGGHNYRHNQIDYPALSEWAQSRRGQVIICEDDRQTWMTDVQPVRLHKGSRNKTVTEVMWYRESNVSPLQP